MGYKNSIINRSSLLLIFLATALVSRAQEKIENALLWKISGNGLQEESFLFGTIHMISREDFFLPQGMEQSFNKTKALVMELDMSEAGGMEQLLPVMDKVFMREDTTLQDLLNQNEYKQVEAFMESMGLPMILFDRMKPLFLSAMVSPDMNPETFRNGETKSYEIELSEWAKKEKKLIKGLESVEFQISIFDSIPYAVQARMLMQAIQSSTEGNNTMQKMVELYKSQNLMALHALIDSESEGMKPYMHLMLNNRNEKWIPEMIKNMQQMSCFFAVGAGHLSGQKGLIQLLRDQNYRLEPISK